MKVLVISHTCFSTYNNMGKTFCSLFSEFEKEELCQLYIYPSLPDVDVCSSYYRVTDKDVIKSLCCFRAFGKKIDPSLNNQTEYRQFENRRDEALYKKRGNTSAIARILRDLLWVIGKWYDKNLESWIEKEQPDCIFLAPGYAKFIYNIAFKISKKYDLPIVTYICDDYYFVKKPSDFIGSLQFSLLKTKIKKLFKRTKCLITISEEIKILYEEKFKVKATVIMTGANENIFVNNHIPEKTGDKLCYFGNIGANRAVSLKDIGEVLDQINSERGSNYQLHVYTSETEKNITLAESMKVHNFLYGAEFEKTFISADFIIHTEAFDSRSMDLVKNSISTKIADSLYSGIPMIAYGPENISSMNHLFRNDCAFIANSKVQLKEVLLEAFDNEERRKHISHNAVKTAKRFHNRKNNSMKIKDIFEEILNERTATERV